MNGNNRHAKYRKSIYRKRRLRIILIASTVFVIVLALSFLIIGNLLNSSDEDAPPSSSNEQQSDVPMDNGQNTQRQINGYPVLIETTDSTTVSSRFQTLKNSGAKEACVPLNRSDGVLLYRSTLSVESGYQAEGERSVTADKLMQAANASEIYVSGTFYVTAFSIDNDLKRTVELSRLGAIIAEALRSGINDILLIAPDMTEAHLPEFYRFIEGIYLLCPDATLGLTLNAEITDSQNCATIIDSLSQKLNFLALDLTDNGHSDPIAHAEEKANKTEMHYNIIRYNMRVLIPEIVDDQLQTELISVLKSGGISNWQILSSTANINVTK